MVETNYTYNKLPAANKIFTPPSPLIEKLLPATNTCSAENQDTTDQSEHQ